MRLDGRTIPYRVLANGVRLGGVVVFGVATAGSSETGTILSPTLVGVVALGVLSIVGWELTRFRRFGYDLTEETVDIRSGVFSRRNREIPYERIQNVDIAQNAVQRILGISEVRLETAGGGSTEARLRYVDAAEADRLQEVISRRKRGTTTDKSTGEAEETLLFELSAREHLVLGVVSADLRLLGLLSIGLPAVAPRLAQGFGSGFDLVSLFGPAIALIAIVGFWGLSGALQVLRYYGFRLTRLGDELRYERGLFQRFGGTVPLSKVQTVMLRENVLARRLGYASLSIQTAGYAPGSGDSNVESAVPIAERDRALALARDVEPFGDLSFTRPPTRARTRYAVRYALAVLGLTGVLWLGSAVTGLLALWYVPLAALPAVPIAAHLAWTHRGYYADEDYVVTRNGFWRRETIVVPYERVQTVASSQTVFQRRRDLGTVTIDTAGGGGLGNGNAVAVDIDASVADQLRETVAKRLQSALAASSHPSPASPSKTTRK